LTFKVLTEEKSAGAPRRTCSVGIKKVSVKKQVWLQKARNLGGYTYSKARRIVDPSNPIKKFLWGAILVGRRN